MIKNIIFDLDDTLLDFKRGEYEGVRDILESQHVPNLEVAFEYYLAMVHKSRIRTKISE
ncbi:hypothetical protein AB3K25_02175 [Leuconostoc sp. MS02]|uniref:Uncharacterized protein n=1 Tax=Leuconostoc aquikimchii TaxID=3236804 RepID=A0ABV3S489_9LACO